MKNKKSGLSTLARRIGNEINRRSRLGETPDKGTTFDTPRMITYLYGLSSDDRGQVLRAFRELVKAGFLIELYRGDNYSACQFMARPGAFDQTGEYYRIERNTL